MTNREKCDSFVKIRDNVEKNVDNKKQRNELTGKLNDSIAAGSEREKKRVNDRAESRATFE